MDDPYSPLGSDQLGDRLCLNLLSKSSPSRLPPTFQVQLSRSITHQSPSQQRQRSRPINNSTSGSSNGNGPSKRKVDSSLSHVPCKFFRQGTCTAGTNCPFSHNQLDPTSESSICKYFLKGNCRFGNKCALVHILSSSQSDPRGIHHGNVVTGSLPPTAGIGIARATAYSPPSFHFGSFFSSSPLPPAAPPPTLQQQQWHLSSPPQPIVLGNIQGGGNSSSSMSGDEEDYDYRGVSIPGQRTATNHLFRFLDDDGPDPFSPFPTATAADNLVDDDAPMFFMQDEELPSPSNDRTEQPSRLSQNFAFPPIFLRSQQQQHNSAFPRS